MSELALNESPPYLDLALESIGESYTRFRLTHPRSEASMLNSICKFGQLTPVVVGGEEKGRYEMIDGFKRLRALRHLKRECIRARVLDGHGRIRKAAMIQLNREGRSLRDMEEALVVQSLHREEGLSQMEIASFLGRDKSWVSRRIALIERLSEEVLEHLRLGLISPTQGREMIRLPRGNQKAALDSVLKHRLCSRETRRLVGMLIEHPRWEHEAILRLPLDILDDRNPPRPSKRAPACDPLDAALSRLETCCNLVIQGIDQGLFSEVFQDLGPILKVIEETLNRLKHLALKGAF